MPGLVEHPSGVVGRVAIDCLRGVTGGLGSSDVKGVNEESDICFLCLFGGTVSFEENFGKRDLLLHNVRCFE